MPFYIDSLQSGGAGKKQNPVTFYNAHDSLSTQAEKDLTETGTNNKQQHKKANADPIFIGCPRRGVGSKITTLDPIRLSLDSLFVALWTSYGD